MFATLSLKRHVTVRYHRYTVTPFLGTEAVPMSQDDKKTVDLQFAINRDLCIPMRCLCGGLPLSYHRHGGRLSGTQPGPGPPLHWLPALFGGLSHRGAVHLRVQARGFLHPLPQSLPSDQQVAALMRGRRSVRAYKPEPLSPQTIAELLATTTNAPTGKNKRQCLFTVIEDQASMDILRRRPWRDYAGRWPRSGSPRD